MASVYPAPGVASPAMSTVARGHLLEPSAAPATGERVEELARIHNLVIEQIVTGVLEGPVDYEQEQDEWVLVIDGVAELEVAGQRVDMAAGDWVLLPAGTHHRLVQANPGTRWLAVHLFPGS